MARANNTAVKFELRIPAIRRSPTITSSAAGHHDARPVHDASRTTFFSTQHHVLRPTQQGRLGVMRRPSFRSTANDVFMGKNCHIDIFPRLLDFLDRSRAEVADGWCLTDGSIQRPASELMPDFDVIDRSGFEGRSPAAGRPRPDTRCSSLNAGRALVA